MSAPAPKALSAVERAAALRAEGRFEEAFDALAAEVGPEAGRLRELIRFDSWGPSLEARSDEVRWAEIERELAARPGEIAPLVRAGQYWQGRDRERAAEYLQQANRLGKAVDRTVLANVHWLAAADELYGDMLVGNRHYGHARGLYSKAYAMFEHWPAQSGYTRRRMRELIEKLKRVDAAIFQPDPLGKRSGGSSH